MEMINFEKKPHEKGYKFMVRNRQFETENRFITGRQVLETAGLLPVTQYKLDLKMKGNRYREVGLDELVDLSDPGIEKFTYISRTQSEG